MEEKTKEQLLDEKLQFTKKNVYEEAAPEKCAAILTYAEGYKAFLDAAKTEREAVAFAVDMAEKAGYTPYRIGDVLKAGDKRYLNNRGRSLFLIRMGSAPLETDGVRIIAAHVDSPRLDLKQIPLYEDSGFAFLKTHYYGGIKKYQWTTIPLALHGTVVRADGTMLELKIGECESDPVFYVNDLLPHLGQEQAKKPLGEAIPGEALNILVGGLPLANDDGGERIKRGILRHLYENYGMTEEDFISAELCAVPAYRARDIGFDRALIGGYGHDDRVCAYPALTALFDSKNDNRTVLIVLADKEEVGSDGVSGMQCDIIRDHLDAIADSAGVNPAVVRAASMCLSADVNAAYDPNFADVYERRNSAMISCGTTLSKYTGARGKSSTNDASAEYVGYIRRLFAEEGVIWQTAELGRVDAGGGGTVAKYIAKLNIDTVDIGVPVISMHAPYEVISKADLYTTYEAFAAFIK